MNRLSNNQIIAPKKDFEYYKKFIYWNNFEAIRAHINASITTSDNVDWIEYFAKKYGKKDTAFILNCGNGWVERDLFKKGVASKFIGSDINQKMLNEAQNEADKIGMPAQYIIADVNNFDFSLYPVDIVVNHAAMHHVAYINRMTETIANMTRGHGLYLNYDYVGHHRNQYDKETWERCIEVRNCLPEKYRTPLRYPHMPTMLATDPSEAIHSELQIEIMQRHFDILEYAKLGGGIAYILLYQNTTLYQERNTVEGKNTLQLIINEDQKLLQEHPSSNLFAFVVAKAKEIMPSESLRLTWQAEEDNRELLASQNAGRYYPPTSIELQHYRLTHEPAHLEKIVDTVINHDNIEQESERFINLLYQHLLLREPDPNGLTYHKNRLLKGVSPADIFKSFVNSPEYQHNIKILKIEHS